MSVSITNTAAKAAADAIVDLIDGGSGAGKLVIYGGTPPADADTAITDQTKLAELTFSDPAFGAAADDTPGAIATADTITQDSSADATGTATFFRAVDSAGNTVIQGSVGTSGEDLNLVTTSIVATQPVQVSSLTFSIPESAA